MRAVEGRLRNYGHSNANIAGRVFGVESNQLRVNYAINKHKLVGQYFVCENYLEHDEKMKFDVVIGNPPYQDGNKGGAKRWVLWHQFYKKSIDLAKEQGCVALITPTSWMGPGELYQLITQNQIVYLDLTAGDHFNVGSSFGACVLKKHYPQTSGTVKTHEGELTVNFESFDFLPSLLTPLAISINKKVLVKVSEGLEFRRTTEYHSSKKHLFSPKGKISVFHTNAQTLKTNENHENNQLPRVMISLSGYPTPIATNSMGASQAVAWVPTDTLANAKNLAALLGKKLFRHLLGINKWSGWNDLTVLKTLPKVDLSRSWSDQELYEHFGLTQEEISYIEATINLQ